MTTTLPSDIQQTRTVIKYEILKYLRGKKLLMFAGLIALILGLLTAMPYLLDASLPDNALDLMKNYLGFATLLIILAVTLFAADSLASEFEHRTGLLLLPRPIKREVLFAGKFIASFMVSAVMILIFYVTTFVIALAVTGDVVSDGIVSLGMAMLYVLAATGFAFMLSAFMARGNTAAILLFATLLLVFPIIDTVFMLAQIDPWFSLSHAGEAVYNELAGLSTGDIEVGPGMTMTEYYAEIDTAAPVLLVWAVLTTLIASLKFKRREL